MTKVEQIKKLKEELKTAKMKIDTLKALSDFIKMHNEYLHCPKCKKDFKQIDKYTWEPVCNCCKTKIRLCKG